MSITFKDNTKAKINSSYNPPDNIQFDRRMAYKRYTDMQNARYLHGVPIENRWKYFQKQYEALRPPREYDDWQSDIVPPITTTIVERALAEMVGQTLRPKIIARGPEDAPKAKLLNYIVDYTWERGYGDLTLADSLKQCLVLGKTIWQEDYYIDKREVKVLKKFNPEKKIEEYETKIIYDYNDVYGEKVDLVDFFIDPAARTVNRGRYKAKDCIRRYFFDYDVFMETFKDSIWDQFGATQYVRPGTNPDDYQYYTPPASIKDNEVEVLFFWGRVPDKLIIIANDVVIRDGPNPYNHKQLPFAEGNDITRLDSFWSRGEPELLSSIQDELTTIRRMRIDKQHLDILKPTFVSNRELLEEDENIVHPGAFVPVDDPSNIKFPEYSDISASAYREEELLKQDAREVTGVQDPQPSGTATEAAIFKESTMKTLQMKIWRLSRELLTDIIRLRVPNIVQYYTAENVEKITGANSSKFRRIMTKNVQLNIGKDGSLVEKTQKGENYFDIDPKMIDPQYGGYDFILTGEPSLPLSKPLRQQKILEFMQHPIMQAAIQTGYYDINKVADVLSEEHEYDPDKFRVDNAGQEEPAIDEQQFLELANRENEIMLKGQILPGTPYAPAAHTDIHLAFMDSEEFKKSFNEKVGIAFSRHIIDERQAQEARGQGTPNGELKGPAAMAGAGKIGTPGGEAKSIMGGDMKATSPGRVVGKEMLPEGII